MSADAATDREDARVPSLADGGIVAQLRLAHPDLLLRPTLERVPSVTVEPDYWTTVGDDRTIVYLDVHGSEHERFEAALGADPTVANPVLVDRYPDRRVYRIDRTDRVVSIPDAVASAGGRVLSRTSAVSSWQVQLRFPGREELVAFNDHCRRAEVAVTVDHLRRADRAENDVVSLTEKQRELLTVAYEEGYFDVPRRISQEELAARLGVSKSAVSQRLRRAIFQLCATTFS